MFYRAYLDAIRTEAGRTAEQLLDEADSRGYGPRTKATELVAWLRPHRRR